MKNLDLDALSNNLSKLAIAVQELADAMENGKVEEPSAPAVTAQDCRLAAVKLTNYGTEGMAALKRVLSDMGIARVSACPADHLWEFHSRIIQATQEMRNV